MKTALIGPGNDNKKKYGQNKMKRNNSIILLSAFPKNQNPSALSGPLMLAKLNVLAVSDQSIMTYVPWE